jgi:hypothetical protein
VGFRNHKDIDAKDAALTMLTENLKELETTKKTAYNEILNLISQKRKKGKRKTKRKETNKMKFMDVSVP